MIWNEERIREEIAKLDKKTGLQGAKLPITFGNSKYVVGSYYTQKNRPKKFQFSNYFFQNPEFPHEEAVDTIRHEYAHYMDSVIFGKSGHGKTWKQCCFYIDCSAGKYYSDVKEKYYAFKQEKEKAECEKVDRYPTGTVIEHPKFGTGTVVDVIGEGTRRTFIVDFQEEQKRLNALWVADYCTRCENS